MTHRGNLLAKSGFKGIEWVQKHFDFQGSLYATLTEKVLSQIHVGICYAENVKYSSPKNAAVSNSYYLMLH